MPCSRLLAALLGLCLSVSASARVISAEEYGYPITNPFEATIAGTPSQLRADLPQDKDIRQKDYSITLRPERAFELPDNFWAVTKMRYRLAWQKGPAPLIFIIAGTGNTYASSQVDALKKLFYGAGFHVVQLSSPTSYDFMVSASRFATPGSSQEDAQDLYRAMQAIRARHDDLEVTEYHLTGYSLGGLNAAFVSHLDESRQSFNFKRVLMLNPPVNLYTSITNLDRLVQTQVEGINNSTNFYDLVLKKLTKYFQDKGYIDINEAMLYDFQMSPEQLTNEQMAMLIGTVFRFASSDMVFTSDLLNRRGLITPIDYPITEGTSLTPFMKRALLCDFNCYMIQQLVPAWRARTGGNSVAQMVNEVSLYSLEDYLRKSTKIGVMHNADDIILGPGDLGFLERTMGDRMTLYPHGGHCGNLNYRVNAKDILEFFRG